MLWVSHSYTPELVVYFVSQLAYRVHDAKIVDTHHCNMSHVYDKLHQMKGTFDSHHHMRRTIQ